jgi:replicative DNA helicase
VTAVEERPVEDRTPPHDVAAEQSALGGMLLSAEAIADVTDIISVRDFYQPSHAAVFSVLLDQYSRGEPTDAVSVGARLMEVGDLGRIGGAAYLHTLIESVPTAANAAYYAKIVRKRARRRRAIEAGTRIVQLGYSTDLDDEALADRANQIVQDATSDTLTGDLAAVGDLVPGFLADLEAGSQQGLSTGLADLDRLTGGLQPGLWIVAARPSVGKTITLTDIARAVALRARQPAVFFSLEMSRKRLMHRLVAAEARVPLHVIKAGGDKVQPQDWERIGDALADIVDAPLHIDDSTSMSVADISARTRRLAQKGALGAVLIDYLQLMEGMGGRGNESREREVARISRGLKVLAEDLQVPVIVAAQLNRGPEQRTDKRPVLSDLRESGAIESDADVVILLHRPDYYDKESERAGEVDLIVAKNRDGPTDTITAAAQLHLARFTDMAISADSFYANAARAA